jgi:class 3 adenylate cyclase
MFVDVVGFTGLTEKLMEHGTDGAEVLTDVLNRIFQPMVTDIYRYGGFIATFAGDAFTALFPCDGEGNSNAVMRSLSAAESIREFVAGLECLETRYGMFDIGISIGLSSGEVEWGILKGSRYSACFFRGRGICGCASAAGRAGEGEILIDGHVRSIAPVELQLKSRKPYFVLSKTTIEQIEPYPSPEILSRTALEPFCPSAILDLVSGGVKAEFRCVAPLFIRVFEPADDSALEEFTITVMDVANEYGGYFNKIDFGEKGCRILILFGAPVAHERDLIRAVDFLLCLRERWTGGGKRDNSGLKWHAGVAYGTVYAGIVGGRERCEYTVIGDVANVAARLSEQDGWGEILMSDRAARELKSGYRVDAVGQLALKGKRIAIPAFRLSGRKAAQKDESAPFSGELIGREEELSRLERFFDHLQEGRFAGVACIHGEAGIGKSRLAFELERRMQEKGNVSWFYCPAEEILRQSLNPFKHFLRRYFAQDPSETMESNRARLENKLDEIVSVLNTRPIPDDGNRREQIETVIGEISRTRSFLAALIDLHWEDSLYTHLDPRYRFSNMLDAFVNLVKGESLRRPVVLQIEDMQWLDRDSHELLRLLSACTGHG